jgi:hypothetical protein
MNIFITKADLMAAISKAINNVYLPKLIPAIVTVIAVNARSVSHTKI